MNDHQLEELEIPSRVLDATERAELARIWLADGNQVAIVSSRLWSDPGVWGLMLVDLAKHVAHAYAHAGTPADVALSKIREAMDSEWSKPTG
jgi:hypothetical protein